MVIALAQPNWRKAGMPPKLVAALTPRTIASATTSEAVWPIAVTSPFLTCPVASVNHASPSNIEWEGRIARAIPSWAIIATTLACSWSTAHLSPPLRWSCS